MKNRARFVVFGCRGAWGDFSFAAAKRRGTPAPTSRILHAKGAGNRRDGGDAPEKFKEIFSHALHYNEAQCNLVLY